MIQISPHYVLDEVQHSDTAIREGIDNMPDAQSGVYAVRQSQLCLEPMRHELGDHSMRLNSWFRGYALNRRIGGSTKSAHMQARACDVPMHNEKHRDMFHDDIELMFKRVIDCQAIQFDKVILEFRGGAEWIHIQSAKLGREPRRTLLVARANSDGRMIYSPYD